MEKDIKYVAKSTNMFKLADSISKSVENGRQLEIISMGEYAVNQMVKALARSRSYLRHKGINIVWYTDWEEVVGRDKGDHISALVTRLIIKKD